MLALPPNFKQPSSGTLAKYGLTLSEWLAILKCQGNVCAICQKFPKSGRMCVDHDHIRGWKKLEPAKRRKHVRGILCFFCNAYYIGRALTIAKALRVAAYLEAHEARKNHAETRIAKSVQTTLH